MSECKPEAGGGPREGREPEGRETTSGSGPPREGSDCVGEGSGPGTVLEGQGTMKGIGGSYGKGHSYGNGHPG